jgi:hypothetical protein
MGNILEAYIEAHRDPITYWAGRIHPALRHFGQWHISDVRALIPLFERHQKGFGYSIDALTFLKLFGPNASGSQNAHLDRVPDIAALVPADLRAGHARDDEASPGFIGPLEAAVPTRPLAPLTATSSSTSPPGSATAPLAHLRVGTFSPPAAEVWAALGGDASLFKLDVARLRGLPRPPPLATLSFLRVLCAVTLLCDAPLRKKVDVLWTLFALAPEDAASLAASVAGGTAAAASGAAAAAAAATGHDQRSAAAAAYRFSSRRAPSAARVLSTSGAAGAGADAATGGDASAAGSSSAAAAAARTPRRFTAATAGGLSAPVADADGAGAGANTDADADAAAQRQRQRLSRRGLLSLITALSGALAAILVLPPPLQAVGAAGTDAYADADAAAFASEPERLERALTALASAGSLFHRPAAAMGSTLGPALTQMQTLDHSPAAAAATTAAAAADSGASLGTGALARALLRAAAEARRARAGAPGLSQRELIALLAAPPPPPATAVSAAAAAAAAATPPPAGLLALGALTLAQQPPGARFLSGADATTGAAVVGEGAGAQLSPLGSQLGSPHGSARGPASPLVSPNAAAAAAAAAGAPAAGSAAGARARAGPGAGLGGRERSLATGTAAGALARFRFSEKVRLPCRLTHTRPHMPLSRAFFFLTGPVFSPFI